MKLEQIITEMKCKNINHTRVLGWFSMVGGGCLGLHRNTVRSGTRSRDVSPNPMHNTVSCPEGKSTWWLVNLSKQNTAPANIDVTLHNPTVRLVD